MAVVIFFEKPGCAGNKRQKQALQVAGHTVVARSLLDRPWTRDELLSFFRHMPLPQWFNRNAPAVKSGEIAPEQLDEEGALALLLKHPLLIRRPLMEANGERRAGFDVAAVHAWIGLGDHPPQEDMEACRHGEEGHVCQGHAEDDPCGHHGKEGHA